MAEFMHGDVQVPGAGRIKKKYIAIPAALALAYVTYRWYVASQEGGEETGDDGSYSSDDLSEYGDSTTGGTGTVTGNNGSQTTDGTTGTIDTNSEWTQEAVELLTNAGYDPAAVAAALGEFLARRSLDKSEASIARAALAMAGQPPVNGPYTVIEEAGSGTGTLPAPGNARKTSTTSTSVNLAWDAVNGARNYTIYRSDLGVKEPVGYSTDTKAIMGGLQPNTTYKFTVAAVSTSGKVGKRSNTITAKTNAVQLAKPTGLKASNITKSGFRVTCSPVKGATYYRWYVNGQGASATDNPWCDFHNRKANTTYSITVRADTTNQSPGPLSSPLKVKTKK